MKEIKIAEISFPSVELSYYQIPQLRGSISSQFIDNDIFHNHDIYGKNIYRSPLVQYKMKNKVPIIMIICREGMEEVFADSVNKVFNELKELNIGNDRFEVGDMEIKIYKSSIGVDNAQKYYFETPCCLLNLDNYNIYKHLTFVEKTQMLERLLTNHLLSFFDKNYIGKGLVVENFKEKIVSNFYSFKEIKVRYKGVPLIGVRGSFSVNLRLPDFLSVGSHKSNGYGTIVSSI